MKKYIKEPFDHMDIIYKPWKLFRSSTQRKNKSITTESLAL